MSTSPLLPALKKRVTPKMAALFGVDQASIEQATAPVSKQAVIPHSLAEEMDKEEDLLGVTDAGTDDDEWEEYFEGDTEEDDETEDTRMYVDGKPVASSVSQIRPLVPGKSWLRCRFLEWRRVGIPARSNHTACFMDRKLVVFGGHTADDEVHHAYVGSGSSAQTTEHVFIIDVSPLCSDIWFADESLMSDETLLDDGPSSIARGKSDPHSSGKPGRRLMSEDVGGVVSSSGMSSTPSPPALMDRVRGRRGGGDASPAAEEDDSSSQLDSTLAVTSISSLDKAHKTRRVGHVCVTLEHNKSMYVFGGWNGSEYLKYGLLFNLDTMRLVEEQTKSRRLPHRRRDHSLVKMGPYLLLFGGWSHTYTHNGNELWCMDHSWQWHCTDVNGMPPCPRRGHSAVVFDSKMYIFGGLFGFSKYLNDMFVYDGDTNSWNQIEYETSVTDEFPERPDGHPRVPPPRAWHSAVGIGNRQILVYGGTAGRLDFYGDLWVFDTVTRRWFELETHGLVIPGPRAGHTMTVVHQDVSAMTDYNLLKYDPTRKHELGSPKATRVALRLVVFGGMGPTVIEPSEVSRKQRAMFARKNLIQEEESDERKMSEGEKSSGTRVSTIAEGDGSAEEDEGDAHGKGDSEEDEEESEDSEEDSEEDSDDLATATARRQTSKKKGSKVAFKKHDSGVSSGLSRAFATKKQPLTLEMAESDDGEHLDDSDLMEINRIELLEDIFEFSLCVMSPVSL